MMCAGVGKSGSPMARERIFFPWPWDSAMRSLMRTVGEGSIERTRFAKRAIGTGRRRHRKSAPIMLNWAYVRRSNIGRAVIMPNWAQRGLHSRLVEASIQLCSTGHDGTEPRRRDDVVDSL